MRLTCPSCGAKYEIASEMIPAGGRDVQCSNCSTTWFQLGEPKRPAPVESFPDLKAARSARGGAGPDPADLAADPVGGEDVMGILREERAFESRARAAERNGRPASEAGRRDVDGDVDVDGDDAGAADPPSERDAAISKGERERARMAAAAALARARRKGGASDPDAPENADPAEVEPVGTVAVTPATAPREGRGDALPEIEAVRTDPPARARPVARDRRPVEAEPDRGRGFRLGFVAALAVIGVLAALYLFAADIASAVPGLADPLTGYVGFVDTQRAALARGAQALTAWFDGTG
ncbi:zinc-ribbon domain-containing protein [Jannaschia sp. LMIT008]|uniref:zinc-ribbon domain-containing protein n=1 Tax=Jannaschia maritima TaxID=3032585 RepID=UPI0028110FDF|nr:zinc-ribbon domain-containing protein [Jannaschia sp. LMIT008]